MLVARLVELINVAYAEAERELWLPGTERISSSEVADIVAAGEMAVARGGREIVGSVRVRQLDADTGFFGLLAVDCAAQGQGVGAALVRFAEETARSRGATRMELRLLVPRGGRDPHKTRLDEWYSRLGYRVIGSAAFGARNPAAVAAMRTPLDILTYRKRL